jgi:PAS domain S-box-containing protein
VSEPGLTQSQGVAEHPRNLPRRPVGLLIEDAPYRRLIEGIAINLGLQPALLEDSDLESERLFDFEMVIADEQVARRIRPFIRAQQASGEQINPALVALVAAPYTASSDSVDREAFDAVLALPENPSLVAAQLGVALYAHRAMAQRYQSALEELSLNRNIFKSVTSGISVANAQEPDLPLIYVNPAFELMTGYSLEEVEGKNCRFLQREDRNQPGLTLIREALTQKRETVAVVRNYRKDGSWFWNELAISPIFNREGVVTHFVGIQMDVTERVEFESALRESEKLAAVGRLASSIAHEINNPLEAVMNLVYLAQRNLPQLEANADSRRYIAQADRELQRVKLITAQSLRFYKQSNGPEAVTCDELLAPILDIYSSRMANFHITLDKKVRSTQHIVCLSSEVMQVLSNLIANAIDAMRSGGGRLTVRTREATEWRNDRRGVVFTIADNGHGMSRETRANLYKAFYTTKGASGTGLGLWISGEIVRRHHGRLRVRSRQTAARTGTVFQLFLPFQSATGEAVQGAFSDSFRVAASGNGNGTAGNLAGDGSGARKPGFGPVKSASGEAVR